MGPAKGWRAGAHHDLGGDHCQVLEFEVVNPTDEVAPRAAQRLFTMFDKDDLLDVLNDVLNLRKRVESAIMRRRVIAMRIGWPDGLA